MAKLNGESQKVGQQICDGMEKDGLPVDQNPITDAPPTFQENRPMEALPSSSGDHVSILNKTFNYGSCSNNKAKNDIPFNNSF